MRRNGNLVVDDMKLMTERIFGGWISMDFELFLESKLPSKSLAEVIESSIINLLNEKVSVQNDEEEIVIGTDYFSLALELEDISDINFVRTHYDLDRCLKLSGS